MLHNRFNEPEPDEPESCDDEERNAAYAAAATKAVSAMADKLGLRSIAHNEVEFIDLTSLTVQKCLRALAAKWVHDGSDAALVDRCQRIAIALLLAGLEAGAAVAYPQK